MTRMMTKAMFTVALAIAVCVGCADDDSGDGWNIGDGYDSGADVEGGEAGQPDTSQPDTSQPDTGQPGGNCTGQDATGEGDCRASLGFKWSGYHCETIYGCSCDGDDCDKLFGTKEDCAEAYAHCDYSCGGVAGYQCADGWYCDYEPRGYGCNSTAGTCARSPDACVDQVEDPVCGCDGEVYSNPCYARSAGVDIAHEGSCP